MKKVVLFFTILFFTMLFLCASTVYADDKSIVELEDLRTTNSKVYTIGGNKYIYEYYIFRGDQFDENNEKVLSCRYCNSFVDNIFSWIHGWK